MIGLMSYFVVSVGTWLAVSCLIILTVRTALTKMIVDTRRERLRDILTNSSGSADWKVKLDFSQFIYDERKHQLRLVYLDGPSRKYILLNPIGRGGFSTVWQVLNPQKGIVLAAKVMAVPQGDDLEAQMARKWILRSITQEIMLSKEISHPNLIGTIDHLCWESDKGIISGMATIHELCDEDLGAWLRRTPLNQRNRSLMKQWLKDILCALDYLHTVRKVVHLDIKPQNILLKAGRCKVSDYGLCRLLRERADLAANLFSDDIPSSTMVDMSDQAEWSGTLIYQPPEHLQGLINGTKDHAITTKFDIWSVGCVAYEMFYGTSPFRPACKRKNLHTLKDLAEETVSCQKEFFLQVHKQQQGDRRGTDDNITEKDLIAFLLAWDPSIRMTARSADEHIFLNH